MPLEVQIGGNTRGFEVAMARAQAVAAVGAVEIRRRFESSAEGIAAAYGKKLLVPLAGAAGAVAGFLLLKTAIEAVTDSVQKQIEEILKVADAANKVGVNAGFYQTWLAESEKLKVSTEELNAALGHAFQTLKERVDPSFDALDKVDKSLEDMRIRLLGLQEVAGALRGLELFKNASNQEQRIIAIVTAAKELMDVGLRLEAINLFEAGLGSQLADQLRRGNLELGAFLENLEKAPRFSSELVERTKEVDLALQQAKNTLQREWEPTLERLIGTTNNLKEAWAGVISTIAGGISTLEEWSRISGGSISRLIAVKLGLVDALGGKLANQAGIGDIGKIVPGAGGGADVPIPRRRPPGAPEVPDAKEINETKDALDRAIDSANKHAVAMNADAESVGLNAEQHARLKTTMTLYAIAAQNNIPITADLAARIQEAANNAGASAAKYESATKKLRELNSISHDLGGALAEAFKGATLEGKKLNEVMQNLLNRLASKSIDKVFDLFFASQGSTPSLFASLFTGKASGGPVMAGSPYIVGEKGPEFFVPKTSGTIIPNGAGANITYAPNVTISGASTVTAEQLAVVLANERRQVVPLVRQAMLRRAL